MRYLAPDTHANNLFLPLDFFYNIQIRVAVQVIGAVFFKF